MSATFNPPEGRGSPVGNGDTTSPAAAPARPPVIVVNPASANGATARRWGELEATIRRELGDFEPHFTERPGHATELARAALQQGATLVVAMGGDGTLNEVVNGFFVDGKPVAPHAALGILPTGTGGDFIKTTGTPRDLAEAVRRLARADERTIDAGRLTFVADDGTERTRWFANIASFGISGLVDRLVNSTTKVFGGKASFYIGTVRASLRYRNARCRVRVDDGPAREQAIYALAVANGRFFGGGMKVAPDALLDDGKFDVVAIGDIGMATLLLHGSKIYSGKHVDMPWVGVARGTRVVAEPLDPRDEVLLDVDGEAPGRLPATFELVPGALRLRG